MKYLPLETHAELRNAKCYKIMQFLLWLHYPLLSLCFFSQYEVRTTTDPAAYPLKPVYIYNFVKVFSYTLKEVLWMYYIEDSVAVLFPYTVCLPKCASSCMPNHSLHVRILPPYLFSPILLYYPISSCQLWWSWYSLKWATHWLQYDLQLGSDLHL